MTHYRGARLAAAGAGVTDSLGWAVAQYPYLIPPRLIAGTAPPHSGWC
jgi:hypothetical protein